MSLIIDLIGKFMISRLKSHIKIFFLIFLCLIVFQSCENYEMFVYMEYETRLELEVESVTVEGINQLRVIYSSPVIMSTALDSTNYWIGEKESDARIEISSTVEVPETDSKSIVIICENLNSNTSYFLYISNIESQSALTVRENGIAFPFETGSIADYGAINLYQPISNEQTDTSPVFMWSSRIGADDYTLEITSKTQEELPDFSNSDLSIIINNVVYLLGSDDNLVLDDITYYWHVCANYSGVQGSFSDPEAFNVIGNRLYVWNKFDGRSCGNQSRPYKNIQDAIDYAGINSISDIYVAQGIYYEDVIFLDGIKLHGGYDAADWTQDIENNETVISGKESMSIVSFPGNIGTETLIEGFIIRDNTSHIYSSGIYCYESNPVIRNNIVYSGNDDAVGNFGIAVYYSSPDIYDNVIYCADGWVSSGIGAIYYSDPHIYDNIIYGATSGGYSVSIGIEIFSSPLIEDNEIYNGNASEDNIGITCNDNVSAEISGNTIIGSSVGNTNIGIFVNDESAPYINDNNISSGSGIDNSAGITVNSSCAPDIQDNVIYADASVNEVAGIAANDNNLVNIVNNTITTGSGGNNNVGIVLNNNITGIISGNVISTGSSNGNNIGIGLNSYCSPDITGNTINTGTAADSIFSITCTDNSSPKIINNVINTGIATNQVAGGITCSDSSSPDIRNNTINGGTGNTTSYGIGLSSSSCPAIENNIIFTQSGSLRAGISETNSGTDPSAIRNNNIFDCDSGLYIDFSGSAIPLSRLDCSGNKGNFCDAACLSYCLSTPSGSGNISVDPLFQGSGEDYFNLTSGSPCDVLQGGIDGDADGWGFDNDINSIIRTTDTSCSPANDNAAGWSIGAYEYN